MEITEELMEQTYQFCYHRLNNPDDARDLAQDILCEALQAIAKGRSIRNFQAWYWKMARNRYAVMINRRNHKPTETMIDDYMDSFVYETDEPVDRLVLEEELSRMHAVIARLAAIHREILVQYYIKERPIREIAKEQNLPEGTVKRRLFDARQEAKKEMSKMPRVTELSYTPHVLEIWASQAWDQVEVHRDLLGRQILATCYQRGYSVSELSEMLQVASVYLEDKLSALESLGLLKRGGRNRYLTNFVIFPRTVVDCMLQKLEGVYATMCETVYDMLMGHWGHIRDIGFYGMELQEEYLNMTFLPQTMNLLGNCCVEQYRKQISGQIFPARQSSNFDNLSDRIMGQMIPAGEDASTYQRKAAKWRTLCKQIDTVSGKRYMVYDNFCTPPFREDRIGNIHGYNVELLYALSRDGRQTLSMQEEINAGILIQSGLLQKRGETYYPAIIAYEAEQAKQITSYMKEVMTPVAGRLQEELFRTINAYLFPHVREDLLEQYYNYIVEIFMIPTSAMIWWGQEKHLFYVSDNPDTCAAGICIVPV